MNNEEAIRMLFVILAFIGLWLIYKFASNIADKISMKIKKAYDRRHDKNEIRRKSRA